METPSVLVAVVMQRRVLQHRWQSEVWEAVGVLAPYDAPGGPRAIVEGENASQWLHPGLRLRLYRDDAEGYYMNISTSDPRITVLWRMEDDRAVPQFVTASYYEASAWMDSGEQVDAVPMPPEIVAWVGEFVRDNYRPEPKKERIRPQSFKRPADRAKN
ncbi:MAG: DUF3305 domain-containing protein [Proteobacteria bacterium]|nr:DUF3305 domain-containing protein [Pseudomonadota bacterium]